MIVRGKHQSEFCITPNSAANDERLSLEARGVLWQLLTKPPAWRIRPKHLAEKNGIGKDKCYRIINELIDVGYIIRTPAREGGRYNQWNYTVYDVPNPANQDDPDEETAPDMFAENGDAGETEGEAPKQQETAENCENSPLPENPEMVGLRPEKPDPEKPFPENQDAYKEHTLRKNRKNPRARESVGKSGRDDPPDKPEAKPPNIEGLELAVRSEEFERVARAFIDRHGPGVWQSWFGSARLVGADPPRLEVESRFKANHIRTHFAGWFEDRLKTKLKITVKQSEAKHA